MSRSKHSIVVTVSAFAVLSAPIYVARAAPTINCTRNISFGAFLPLCNGSITVKGTAGSGTMNSGCHSQVGGVIQPAICAVSTTANPTATQNARITFTAANHQFSNTMGGGQITIDNYLIQTAGGSQLNTHTFSGTLLNPTHTFRVGGRLRFNATEPRGSYSSNFNIVVTAVP